MAAWAAAGAAEAASEGEGALVMEGADDALPNCRMRAGEGQAGATVVGWVAGAREGVERAEAAWVAVEGVEAMGVAAERAAVGQEGVPVAVREEGG